ncbi:MAG: M20/M25/M40 family metallo-hydrolase [Planctomycetota bacterium]|nr:M20/M25/M40 family metallo-hydrolase [Planctomycetota bacterium]
MNVAPRAVILIPLATVVAVSFASPARVQEPAGPADAAPPTDVTVSAEITAAELMAHVKALAADALAGRPMGSTESLQAAEICAASLQLAGLQPGADDGSFLQRITFERVVHEGVPELVCTLADGSETVLFNGEQFTFTMAGRHEDTGALRCVTVGEESGLPAEADVGVALVLNTSAGKARRWLRNAGHGRGEGFGAVVVPRRGEAGERSTPRASRTRLAGGDRGALNVSLKGPIAEAAGRGELRTVSLRPRARLEVTEDANVVAVLPGTEGHAIGEEILILSAHRDHIGLAQPRRGAPPAEAEGEPVDLVNNGADDDASGCAAVMEIAEAMARSSDEAPRRTVVVVLVTGEEAGMIGSKHWVAHPTVDLSKVVCALNFEMLGRPDEMVGGAGQIWLTGDDRSDLGPHLRDACGIAVSADPRLEMNFFVRSDNVSFARAGIVSQTLSSFGGHGDYHRVTDEWDTLDYAHMETAVRACFEATRVLATSEWTPSWNEGEPKLR